MKLGGAAIYAALLVVALIGLQPLVAADSAPEMGNCTEVLSVLSPCIPYMDSARSNRSSSPSPICCQPFGDLASSLVSGKPSESCLCYLLQNPTLSGVRLDPVRIASLIDICHANNLVNRKINPSGYLLAVCEDFQEEKMMVFISALMAFLVSSAMSIYTILYRTVVPPNVPYFTIANMLSFVLATWYGIILKDKESRKISILNGIRAGLELAKIVSNIYRNPRLLKPTLKSFTPAVVNFAVAFGTFQFVLEGKQKQDFFASLSTIVAVILLFVPLFTSGGEVRVQPKKWFAVSNAFVETVACLLWTVIGGSMRDVPTIVSAFVGMMTNFIMIILLGKHQIQELEDEELVRLVGVRRGRQVLERLKRIKSCRIF